MKEEKYNVPEGAENLCDLLVWMMVASSAV